MGIMDLFKSKEERGYYKLCKQCLLKSDKFDVARFLAESATFHAKNKTFDGFTLQVNDKSYMVKYVIGKGLKIQVNDYYLETDEFKAYIFFESLVESLRDPLIRKRYNCDKLIDDYRNNGPDIDLLWWTIAKYFPSDSRTRISYVFFNCHTESDKDGLRRKLLF